MTPPPPPRSGVTGTDSGNTNCVRVRVEGLLRGRDDVVSYSRSVCVCAGGDVARGRGLQHLGGAHHDVKLTCVGGQTKKKKKSQKVVLVLGLSPREEYQRLSSGLGRLANRCGLTSGLRDRGVSGGLHRYGRGRSIANSSGGEISKTRLSAHCFTARAAAVTEGILDNSLEKGGGGGVKKKKSTTEMPCGTV